MITDETEIDQRLGAELFLADNLLAKRFVLSKGDKIGKHIHTYSHLSVLGYGSVRVDTLKGSRAYDSGDCIVIEKETEHTITALEDSVWFCIHTDLSVKE
jgi:quercetin dioxygenase-like cupin family protein